MARGAAFPSLYRRCSARLAHRSGSSQALRGMVATRRGAERIFSCLSRRIVRLTVPMGGVQDGIPSYTERCSGAMPNRPKGRDFQAFWACTKRPSRCHSGAFWEVRRVVSLLGDLDVRLKDHDAGGANLTVDIAA